MDFCPSARFIHVSVGKEEEETQLLRVENISVRRVCLHLLPEEEEGFRVLPDGEEDTEVLEEEEDAVVQVFGTLLESFPSVTGAWASSLAPRSWRSW